MNTEMKRPKIRTARKAENKGKGNTKGEQEVIKLANEKKTGIRKQ